MITYEDAGKEWNGAKLPEVPFPYAWKIRDDGAGWVHLVLFVCDSEEKNPFVLWAYTSSTAVRISRLTDNGASDTFRGATHEEGIHVMTTRVLLGLWDDEEKS